MAKTVLLIDGDQYLYKACAACESETRWDDENHVLASNEVEAWDTVVGSLRKVFDHFGTKEHALCFTGATYFRRELVDPTYKMNRAGQRKPLCFSLVKKRLFAEYNAVLMEGLEADDVMGILATKPSTHERIIVAQDKDMKTIPGKLWDGFKFSVITESQADYWHLYQTLTGDVADGYKGCVGVGPKKAEKILTSQDGMELKDGMSIRQVWWQLVVEAFGNADDALTQARLARILRWTDWDAKGKQPILWTPTPLKSTS